MASISSSQSPSSARSSLFARYSSLLLSLLLLAVFLAPRLPGLGSFVTPDEPTWTKRSGSFFYALAHGNFGGTYLTGHPGVTTTWTGAIAYALRFPNYRRAGGREIGDTELLQVFARRGPGLMTVLATARLLAVLVNGAALLLAFLYARRLFNPWLAFFAFLLIALDPFYTAHSRVLHTNAYLASFGFLTVLAFLDFLRFRRWLSLAVSGAALGLSILTVTPGFFLITIVGLLALAGWFWQPAAARRPWLPGLWRQVVRPLLAWGLVGLLVIFLAWPAMWVNPVGTLGKILGYSLSAAEGEIGSAHFVQSYESTVDSGAMYWDFYPLTYLWRSTPLAWLGLALALAALVGFLWRRGKLTPANFAVCGVLGYALLFGVLMTLGEKKFDRYFLPGYLALDLIAALGWLKLVEWLNGRLGWFKRLRLGIAVLALVIAGQAALTLASAPYYLTYYNPWMGGLKKAPEVMSVGWGEGLNEAALYLKDTPGIKHKRILSWYPLAFSYYSASLGFTAELVEFTPEMGPADLQGYDYVVIYLNQWQRHMPARALDYLATLTPAHTVQIGGVDFARVYALPGALTGK